ncbi:MAG: hypothetical protein IVW57_10775 [Ktedonobacterales bacterium]|nr:hypothetical protein [Ktedonobacterales bacterium]
MVQYKVFTSASCAGDLAAFEGQINEWMRHDRPHIVFFSQTALGADLIVSFVFERETLEELATAEVAAAVPDIFEQSLEQADLDPTDLDIPLLPEAELPY